MPKPADIPNCPSAPRFRSTHRTTREYKISLITPLFGGGVEVGVPDKSLPIRTTAIRGQLRHWWRATVGHDIGGRDEMWRREEEVFGSTEFVSPLNVIVVEQPVVQLDDPSSYGDKFGPIAYALFSAIENQQRIVKEGAFFRLQLSWEAVAALQVRRSFQNNQRKKDRKPLLPSTVDDIGPDIIKALQAWSTLGGLGARTRRGCGAIFCKDSEAELLDMPFTIMLGPPKPGALEAWKEAVKVYRDFRQSPRGKKHQKTINTKNGPKTIQVPGRSHWPEADSIRKLSGSALRPLSNSSATDVSADENPNDHSEPVVSREVLPAFPRAILGLPINFHFADGPGKNRSGQLNKDPQDVQLLPRLIDDANNVDRMSSPIITRPLWHSGKWHPGVIILKQNLPTSLCVQLVGKLARADGKDLSHDLPPESIVSPSLGVLRPMRGHASALEALRDFLKNKGFHEVTR